MGDAAEAGPEQHEAARAEYDGPSQAPNPGHDRNFPFLMARRGNNHSRKDRSAARAHIVRQVSRERDAARKAASAQLSASSSNLSRPQQEPRERDHVSDWISYDQILTKDQCILPTEIAKDYLSTPIHETRPPRDVPCSASLKIWISLLRHCLGYTMSLIVRHSRQIRSGIVSNAHPYCASQCSLHSRFSPFPGVPSPVSLGDLTFTLIGPSHSNNCQVAIFSWMTGTRKDYYALFLITKPVSTANPFHVWSIRRCSSGNVRDDLDHDFVYECYRQNGGNGNFE